MDRDPSVVSSRTSERRLRFRRGLWAEHWAALTLRLKGYRILDRRWRCAAGEIDLVAARGGVVVFVEVKRRPGLEDREAHESVGPHQRRRVHRAAEIWLARHPRWRQVDVRFDLILVAGRRWPRHIIGGL